METLIAKTKPYETLREHTDELRKELEMLKVAYGEKIETLISIDKDEFWRLLDIIVEFHDLGKVFTPFQNKLKNVLNEIDRLIENLSEIRYCIDNSQSDELYELLDKVCKNKITMQEKEPEPWKN